MTRSTYSVAATDDRRATPWRAQGDDARGFDELVVAGWVHLERMSDTDWWMRVGNHVIWVGVGRNGKARRVTVYEPGRYEGVDGWERDPNHDESWVNVPDKARPVDVLADGRATEES